MCLSTKKVFRCTRSFSLIASRIGQREVIGKMLAEEEAKLLDLLFLARKIGTTS
jgi:hypothetical protein